VSESLLSLRKIDQLDFIDNDAGFEVVSFGNHEKTIEHSHVRLGVSRCENDNDLIDVCNNDSISATFTGQTTRELRATGKNFRYCPACTLVTLDHNVVADCQLELVIPVLLQSSAKRRLDCLTVLGANNPDATRPFYYYA